MEKEQFICDCGFKWLQGQSGAHQCEPGFRKIIADLRAELEKAEAAPVGAAGVQRYDMTIEQSVVTLDGRVSEYADPDGEWVRYDDHVAALAQRAGSGEAKPFSPTDQQFAEWCERHSIHPTNREAFEDAASLYLVNRPATEEVVRGPLRLEDWRHCMAFAASLGIGRDSADALVRATASKAYVNGFSDSAPTPQPDSGRDAALRAAIKQALRTSQTGHGSYGPNYDGNKLAVAIEAAMAAQQGDTGGAA